MSEATPPAITLDPVGLTRRVPLQPPQMTAPLTPTEQLFMLAHLGVARPQPGEWHLRVEGLVQRSLDLSIKALASFPQARLEAVHQCAGNPLEPAVATRRVACVLWEGVRLADVLALAGPVPGAGFLWADGADGGSFAGQPVPCYRKDLPLSRVPQDVLLATRLNGAPIPDEHGGPLRLVVPGFYGTNSVKWLWRLAVADRRADGLFTTAYYNDPLPGGGTRPVWALAPEAIFTSPAPGDQLGSRLALRGWAWADAPVRLVEVSADNGATWLPAQLEPRRERAWQAWSLECQLEWRGPLRLLCRATDAHGATQPMTGARNAVHAVEVVVKEV